MTQQHQPDRADEQHPLPTEVPEDTFDADVGTDEELRADEMRQVGYDPEDVGGNTTAVRPE